MERMDETQRICAITGSSAGIGKATAIEMAKKGFHVIMLVRDCDKSKRAFDEVRAESGSDDVRMFCVDLASLGDIRRVAVEVAGEYPRIDVLVNNAGVYKRERAVSPDGYELTLAVNYLAVVLLTELLLPSLERSPEGRIVNVTSELYKRGRIDLDELSSRDKYKAQDAYAASKMLIVLYTRELALRLDGSGVSVNCVHPGVAGTDAFREYPGWLNSMLNVFISSPETAAEPVVYLASSPEVAGTTGGYFNKTEMREIDLPAHVEEQAAEILAYTRDATGVDGL